MKPVFDEAGALDRVSGDKELLIELFDIAFTDTVQRLQDIDVALKQGDAKKLAETAHAVKSAFGNIGAMQCHATAAELEKLGKNQDLVTASALFPEFKSHIEAFKAAVANF